MWEGLEKKKVNYYEWIQGKTNANRRVASSEMEEISPAPLEYDET